MQILISLISKRKKLLLLTNEVVEGNSLIWAEWNCSFTSNTYIIKADNHIALLWQGLSKMLMHDLTRTSSSEFIFNDHYTSFNTLFASEVGSTLRTNTPCTRQKGCNIKIHAINLTIVQVVRFKTGKSWWVKRKNIQNNKTS